MYNLHSLPDLLQTLREEKSVAVFQHTVYEYRANPPNWEAVNTGGLIWSEAHGTTTSTESSTCQVISATAFFIVKQEAELPWWDKIVATQPYQEAYGTWGGPTPYSIPAPVYYRELMRESGGVFTWARSAVWQPCQILMLTSAWPVNQMAEALLTELSLLAGK